MTEQWRDIPGYDGAYRVSDRGNVVSLKISREGNVLTPEVLWNGYQRVALSNGGKIKRLRVHSLVLEAFVGPLPKYKQVNHKNGIKADNRLENLEYLTCAENHRHAMSIGLRKSFTVLTPHKVKEIRNLHGAGKYSQRALAKKFGVSRHAIYAIVHYRTWKHID